MAWWGEQFSYGLTVSKVFVQLESGCGGKKVIE